jgi:hypothetical protein
LVRTRPRRNAQRRKWEIAGFPGHFAKIEWIRNKRTVDTDQMLVIKSHIGFRRDHFEQYAGTENDDDKP